MPGLVLAFTSGIDPDDVASQLAAVRAPVVAGMTGNGVISGAGPIEVGCAALAFEGLVEHGVGVATHAGADLRGAGRAAASDALRSLGEAEGAVLLLLFLDTRSGDQSDAVAGAYQAAGATIPIAGGAAGGANPAQFLEGEPLQNSVVAVALRAPGPTGIGAAHACRAEGAPSIVTRSQGRLVLELDGRPAATVYQEKLGLGSGELDNEAFERAAITHPLAQPELSGDERIRHVLRREGSALLCATHIPVNAAIEFTTEAPDEVVATSSRAVEEATASLRGDPVRAALLFDCAGRKRAVQGGLEREVRGLTSSFNPPQPPIAGLYTHGEIARVRGTKGDLNHAIVVVALG